MARLSRRISRYFSFPKRSTQQQQEPSSPRISKAQISKPIPTGPEDTHGLLSSSPQLGSHAHAHAHTHTSSQYTISDAELRQLENTQLSRRIEDDIDMILAQYASSTPPMPSQPSFPPYTPSSSFTSSPPAQHTIGTSPFADPQIHIRATAAGSASPTPSSNYSSPPASPPTISAKLQRFKDTPPPAPGWEKTSFGRQTRLFGPEGFVDLGGGGRGKDWRGEFGRRGYGVL